MEADQIRQLEWQGHGDKLEASAFGIGVFYRVRGEPGAWELMSPGKTQYVFTPGYETQIDAKNAAQVDFERRVRASMTEVEKGT